VWENGKHKKTGVGAPAKPDTEVNPMSDPSESTPTIKRDIVEVCSIAEAFVEEHYGGDEFLVAELMRACIQRVKAYAEGIA
jgi:hypothetical protein